MAGSFGVRVLDPRRSASGPEQSERAASGAPSVGRTSRRFAVSQTLRSDRSGIVDGRTRIRCGPGVADAAGEAAPTVSGECRPRGRLLIQAVVQRAARTGRAPASGRSRMALTSAP